MRTVVKELLARDGKRKVRIIRRDDGFFGFEAVHFSDEPLEMCWIPDGGYSECIAVSQEIAEREARDRVAWLQAETETDRETPVGRIVLTDPDSASADPSLPAFLAPPEGAPTYHGFVVVEETETDGWFYGAITEFEDPAGCTSGDGFVVAPDGSRAGLAWSVGNYPTEALVEPEEDRWGVYAVAFPSPIRTIDDLVICFRAVLPELMAIHAKLRGTTR